MRKRRVGFGVLFLLSKCFTLTVPGIRESDIFMQTLCMFGQGKILLFPKIYGTTKVAVHYEE